MHDSTARATTAPATPAEAGLIGHLADALTRARQWLDPAAHCPIYTWCEQRGQHFDHEGAQVSIPSPRTGEAPYLTAQILDLDEAGHPFIDLESAALDAQEARREAAKLRAFAGRLEQLADTLTAEAAR